MRLCTGSWPLLAWPGQVYPTLGRRLGEDEERPPSLNVSVDQVGRLARCCTWPGAWAFPVGIGRRNGFNNTIGLLIFLLVGQIYGFW
jgi:hypothetical protein